MTITLSMIGESLKNLYPQAKIQQLHCLPLFGVKLYAAENAAGSNFLFLLKSGSSPLSVDTNLQYLLIGEPDERFNEANYVSIPADTDPLLLIEQISGIFQKFLLWESSLLHSASNDRSIQMLIDLSRDIFKNQVLEVYDASLRLIAESETRPRQYFWTSQAGRAYMGQDVKEIIMKSGFFDLLRTSKKPFIYKPQQTSILACKIAKNDQYFGFLTMPELSSPILNLHVELIETLAFCVAQIFERDMDLLTSDQDSEGDFPLDALIGAKISRGYLEYHLGRLGWGICDNYSVMVIKTQQSKEEFKNGFLIHSGFLKQLFPDSLIVASGRSLVQIVHNGSFLSLDPDEKYEYRHFLDQKILHCGCSNVFSDFTVIADYYNQASTAAGMYDINDRYYPVSLYEDHFSDHVAQTFMQDFQIENYVSPGILALAKHDCKHESELIKTLYEYLINDKSYAACAGRLFIHKSTLKYRLEKIATIAGHECFASEKRISVLLSLKMLM